MSAAPERAWPREEIEAALREALEIVAALDPPSDLRLQTYVSAIAGTTARTQAPSAQAVPVILGGGVLGPRHQ